MRGWNRFLHFGITHFDPWLFFLLALGMALALAPRAEAQPAPNRAPPHVAFVYPAGGRQGTTVTLTLGGQNLAGATAVHFSAPGVAAKVTGYERPLTQKEINDLRDKLQALQEKRAAAQADKSKPAVTPEEEKFIVEARQDLARRGNRQASPVLAESVKLEVTIAADAAPGEHELRLRTAGGFSNPMTVTVGQLPEFAEPVRTPTSWPAPKPTKELDPATQRPKTEPGITLPAVMNGQIMPGEVDRFHFRATRGQRIVLVASARALIPYLADAVPGWFQAAVALRDAKGRELAYADDYRFNPDPVLRYDIPADGIYVVEVKDAIFRGREDFVYRIAIGELPFVTGVFPLGATCGAKATFALSGWNLPSAKLVLDTADRGPGTFLVGVRGNGQVAHPVRIALDGPEGTHLTEPDDGGTEPRALGLPASVDGRIARAGERDRYRFEGKAGDAIVAEITARRLGSPLDAVLKLTDAAGRQIAFNDDTEDRGAGLLTHHADPRISCTLPADGTYTLTVADTQHGGGPELAYRLRVGPPRPDFELRVVPASVNLRAGASVPVTVYALRHDGYAGEIALQLRDAPWGFALGGARIPAGQDKVQVTLTAPYATRDEATELTLVGAAKIGTRTVAHAALPAEDMMQAFAYKHLVTAKKWMVAVTGRAATFRVATRGPVKLVPGGTTRVQIAAPSARSAGKIAFELVDPPEGVTVKECSAGAGDTVTVVLACDAAKMKAGAQGNLLLAGFGERPAGKAAAKGAKSNRASLGTVPAIAFEVAPAAAPPAQ